MNPLQSLPESQEYLVVELLDALVAQPHHGAIRTWADPDWGASTHSSYMSRESQR